MSEEVVQAILKRMDECFEETLNDLVHVVYPDAERHGLYNKIDSKAKGNAIKLQNLCVNRIEDEVFEAGKAVGDIVALSEELADILIMVLSVSGKLGINIGEAVVKKKNINMARSYEHKEDA